MLLQTRKPTGGKHNALFLPLFPLYFTSCGAEQGARAWENRGPDSVVWQQAGGRQGCVEGAPVAWGTLVWEDCSPSSVVPGQPSTPLLACSYCPEIVIHSCPCSVLKFS